LILKQNLFEGVLDSESETDFVDFSEKGRAQFLKQLENVIDGIGDGEELEQEMVEAGELIPEAIEDKKDTIDSVVAEVEDEKAAKQIEMELAKSAKPAVESDKKTEPEPGEIKQPQLAEMEQVMNQGMGFLSGLYKMATGKELSSQEQKIEIDKETGEVVMRFKLPVAGGS